MISKNHTAGFDPFFLLFTYLWGKSHKFFRNYGSNGASYYFLKPETNKDEFRLYFELIEKKLSGAPPFRKFKDKIWMRPEDLVSGRLACTSSITEIFNKIGIYILILNFQVNSKCFFTQKTWKVKIITHDSNHDLIFYCTHNQLCVPE